MDYTVESNEQFMYARKLANRDFFECLKKKKNPNLKALEDIVNENECSKVSLGIIEVPSFLIVGTKTALRAKSFSSNFLPLLGPKTEFAFKWMRVCAYHLSDSGITDPPEAIEYLGKFYIVEGNKRVSVLKSYGAVFIGCNVTRLLPPKTERPEIKLYYEFLDFYQLSHLYSLQFSRLGSYTIFQRALGFTLDHEWTRRERINIVGFEDRLIHFLKKNKIEANHADCLCGMLEMYTFDYLLNISDKELNNFIVQNALRLRYGKGFYTIQCISDSEDPFLYSSQAKSALEKTDFIISAGDLSKEYLEYLVTVSNKPLFYVPGNHDPKFVNNPPEGCICIDDDIVVYQGIRILGLGGSKNYNNGPYQYTEQEMKKRISKLRWKIWKHKGVDIIVTHAPIRGYGDMDDLPHQGFECFKKLLDDLKPKYWFYGHVHMNYNANLSRIQSLDGTILVNVCGKYEIKY